MLLALVPALTAIAIGCSTGDDTPQEAPAAAQQAQQQAQQQVAEPETDGGFDIGNRKHAAVRLTLLAELMRDANPVTDPLSWAKAGYAASVIEEICNNFDIHRDLDAACDQLLLAGEVPWNQTAPIISTAFTELRSIVSRRDMAEAEEEGWATWDDDAINFRLLDAPDNLWGDLSVLKGEMEKVADGSPPGVLLQVGENNIAARVNLKVLVWGLSLPEGEDRLPALLTRLALDDLSDLLTEYMDEDNDYGREYTAQRIVDELDDLGVW